MIELKQDILEEIRGRIDQIQLDIKAEKKYNDKASKKRLARLRQRLGIQKDAFGFNKWLMWRKLNHNPLGFERKYEKE